MALNFQDENASFAHESPARRRIFRPLFTFCLVFQRCQPLAKRLLTSNTLL